VAKDLPGALSMKYLHQFFKGIPWWRLAPAPELVIDQPSRKDAARFIAAAASAGGDLAVVYLPEGGAVKLKTETLATGLAARWFHPRTGGWLDAGEVKGSPQTFEPPDRNDWVLRLEAKNGK
jgi:hypothetical protein